MAQNQVFGELLRKWRQRRRLSQMDLALDAEISTRHLSFMETGRAKPSREMVLALAEQLDVPLRERNVLLGAAGFAPVFAHRSLDDASLGPARAAIDLVLEGHEPYPALAVDRHWTMLAANRSVAPLLAGIDAALLAPPVNVLRLSLHPKGLAPRIVNLDEWRAHLMERLRRQVELTADATLIALMGELRAYPCGPKARQPSDRFGGIVVPLVLQAGGRLLSNSSRPRRCSVRRSTSRSPKSLSNAFFRRTGRPRRRSLPIDGGPARTHSFGRLRRGSSRMSAKDRGR